MQRNTVCRSFNQMSRSRLVISLQRLPLIRVDGAGLFIFIKNGDVGSGRQGGWEVIFPLPACYLVSLRWIDR